MAALIAPAPLVLLLSFVWVAAPVTTLMGSASLVMTGQRATTSSESAMPHFNQHFILTIGRSGSNSLVDALNQHPNVLNYGEVLGDWNTIRRVYKRLPGAPCDEAYLHALLHNPMVARGLNSYRNVSYLRRGRPDGRKSFRRIRSIGVKEFSLNLRRKGLMDFLANRPHIKVIGLRRVDLLDRFISWQMLKATGVVARDVADKTKARRIRLDPESLMEDLSSVQQENQELAAILSTLPPDQKLQISYDAFYGSPEQTEAILQDTYRFLDLPSYSPILRMRKILEGSPLDRIENIDECRSLVQGTPFAPLFEA